MQIPLPCLPKHSLTPFLSNRSRCNFQNTSLAGIFCENMLQKLRSEPEPFTFFEHFSRKKDSDSPAGVRFELVYSIPLKYIKINLRLTIKHESNWRLPSKAYFHNNPLSVLNGDFIISWGLRKQQAKRS